MTTNADYKSQDSPIWKLINWYPSSDQIEQFIYLQTLLKEWNSKVNLTRLVNGSDYWVSQILDSLWPISNELRVANQSKKVIDIGSGCGLPGLAIAIALPNAKITLIDSISRKTKALKSISEAIGLSERVDVRTVRAELAGQDSNCREKYDLAVARAVSKSSVVAEYLIPLLNQTGEAILYQGKWTKAEEIKLKRALKLLKAKIKTIESIKLPENKGIRHLVKLISFEKCPLRYPRAIGVPNKRPLSN